MRSILHALWAVGVAGCATGGGGTFTAEGYESELYPFSVRYAPGSRGFVSREWVIENYSREGSEIGDAKTTRQYVTRVEVDIDDDGRRESVGRTYRYDLRLRHRETNTVMWVRNVVISPRNAELSLEAIADTYIDTSLDPDVFGHSGTVDVTPSFTPGGWGQPGPRIDVTVVVERPRPVIQVTDRLPMTIDGHDAYGILTGITTGEVAEVAPDGRLMQAAVVLIRTNYPHEIRGTRGRKALPTVMVVGYASRPERFAEGMEDFRTLLESLEL